MSFDRLGLDARLQSAITALGFEEPTAIQRDAIPHAILGKDLLACAMTGSGKTAAFVLPMLQRLLEGKREASARALVLVPTRELAVQVEEAVRDFGRGSGLKSCRIFGGVGMQPQVDALRGGVDIIVATPGRLLDHLSTKGDLLQKVQILVLDEADRMLDMGFIPDVKRILQRVPKRRQSLLFSATLPPRVKELAVEMLIDPVRIAVERKSAPADGITQRVFEVDSTKKRDLLLSLLKGGHLGSAIVFTRTKHRTNRLHDYLSQHGIKSARIHGNRSQAQRQAAIEDFRRGAVNVLVATDVAARGIDVEDLSHVVNFDVPGLPEDYIHRVGRTARAQRTGDAFTFVAADEVLELHAIEAALGAGIPRASLSAEGLIETLAAPPVSKRPPRMAVAPRPLRGRAARVHDDRDFGGPEEKAPARGGRSGGGGGRSAGGGRGRSAPAREPRRDDDERRAPAAKGKSRSGSSGASPRGAGGEGRAAAPRGAGSERRSSERARGEDAPRRKAEPKRREGEGSGSARPERRPARPARKDGERPESRGAGTAPRGARPPRPARRASSDRDD